jgi:lipoprotein-releasing system ATP-binding protein
MPDADRSIALRASHLSKEYPTPSGPLSILRDVNLTLEAGQAAAIMGPSGSGKSTLLHILGALDRPSAGEVTLGDVDPFALAEPELARFRNRSVGFVFQDHYLLPQLSAVENVLIPTLPADGATADARRRAADVLDRVGLWSRRDHRPAELSGGERQRVAIARALINGPMLLLCDEPTGNLDRRAADAVAELLLDLQRLSRLILLVATHSVELAGRLPARYELVDGALAPR